MTQVRLELLRPLKVIRKKWRAWKTENPKGIKIAKFFARHRRRTLQKLRSLVRLMTLSTLRDRIKQSRQSSEHPPQSVTAESNAAANESLMQPQVGSDSVLQTIKYFANPGESYEEGSGIDSRSLPAKVRAIAFFLPQFHEFEENNSWWGKGFTEWRNVSRGAPRFAGHYQPRIPRDLGFYNLQSVETIRRQAELAASFGIEAFCFYYYWFNGKKLMHKPLDLFCQDDEIKQQFCIMWANENWTRTWDGHDNEVLIQQDYRLEDEKAFIQDTAHYMSHDRYLKVDGRPLFIIYRPGLLPAANMLIEKWRNLWREAIGEEPFIMMVQGFGDDDPREFGLDGAVEFPPHKVAIDVPDINNDLILFDTQYQGHVRSYDAIIDSSLKFNESTFPLIKTASPHWDNDARREGRGMVLHGSTPEKYERWVNGLIDYATDNPVAGESLIFINAWNEWAESAYLEPDVHYGHAYLNATQRAIHGLSGLTDQSLTEISATDGQLTEKHILLVGHDAHKHGAQMLLMSLAKVYKQQFGMQVVILLRQGGTLLKDYEAITETHLYSELGEDGLNAMLAGRKFELAVCNTSVTGDLVPVIKAMQVPVVSLIHEMPLLIEEFNLQPQVRMIDEHADHIVFPSTIVKKGFASFSNKHAGERHIRPQGTYKSIVFDEKARDEIRGELGIASHEKMVLNVGYADLRKGFDLFLQTAFQWMEKRDDVHFVWVGAIAADLERWIQSDVQFAACSDRIHLVGFSQKMSEYYSAADVLLLTSREDPYPTVVLEAMNVGLPVVLYKGATGFDKVISRYGYLVERGDQQAMELALQKAIDEEGATEKQQRVSFVEENCQLDDYCFELLQLVNPKLKKVSVVVPNYNYEEYLSDRLASIFNQSMPVFEVIVLDDCSTDQSLQMIKSCAKVAGRKIKIIENKTNSGSVFKQWEKGLSVCRGSHIWIAEADDLAQPDFLSQSLRQFKRDTKLSFTDSAQIDESGNKLARSYSYYYKTVDPDLFNESFVMEGRSFIEKALAVKNVILNVSSVVWDRKHLSQVMEKINEELPTYRLVGDWRIYLASLSDPNCDIAYIAESLNIHRRHSSSVTHALDLQKHYNEIRAMHHCAIDILPGEIVQQRQEDYRKELTIQFDLDSDVVKAA